MIARELKLLNHVKSRAEQYKNQNFCSNNTTNDDILNAKDYSLNLFNMCAFGP